MATETVAKQKRSVKKTTVKKVTKPTKATLTDKQYMARILYTREKLEQKLIAEKVGVSEKTIGKLVNENNWRSIRDRLLIGKEEILNNLYEQLAELNSAISMKPEGERYGDSKQADSQVKLTASIRNMEKELAIADLVESGIRFIKYIQKVGTIDQVKEADELWNSFLYENFKK
jgi:transcriptional regulator with XRE-family HTH domain